MFILTNDPDRGTVAGGEGLSIDNVGGRAGILACSCSLNTCKR